MIEPKTNKFNIGDTVMKIRGSEWAGIVVGTYSTGLTPEGYCVESTFHKGSIQIYPASALQLLLLLAAPAITQQPTQP